MVEYPKNTKEIEHIMEFMLNKNIKLKAKSIELKKVLNNDLEKSVMNEKIVEFSLDNRSFCLESIANSCVNN